MTNEQLRIQMLTGIITNPSSDFKRFFYNEEDNTFTFSPDGYNLDLVFSYDGNKLSADFPYSDYGSNREEGEAALDPVIDSLEKVLVSEGIKYEILILSYQYKFEIYI